MAKLNLLYIIWKNAQSVHMYFHCEWDITDGVIQLRLLLAALGSGHVDMASNQVKLLRPRMGREIGQKQLNAEGERGRERELERGKRDGEAAER